MRWAKMIGELERRADWLEGLDPNRVRETRGQRAVDSNRCELVALEQAIAALRATPNPRRVAGLVLRLLGEGGELSEAEEDELHLWADTVLAPKPEWGADRPAESPPKDPA